MYVIRIILNSYPATLLNSCISLASFFVWILWYFLYRQLMLSANRDSLLFPETCVTYLYSCLLVLPRTSGIRLKPLNIPEPSCCICWECKALTELPFTPSISQEGVVASNLEEWSNDSLDKKNTSGLAFLCEKMATFPTSVLFSCEKTHSTQRIHSPFARDLEGKVNCHWYHAHTAYCIMGNTVLWFGPRHLTSYVSIHETVTG